MFESISWDTPVRLWDVVKIGEVIIYSGVRFTIKKHHYSKTLDGKNEITRFNVGCELFGCTMGKGFQTKEETEEYLERQVNNTSKYARLKAKRDAISKRLAPLQFKFSETSRQLFILAESPIH